MLESRKGRRWLLSMCFLVGRSGKFLERIARNLPLNHKNQDFSPVSQSRISSVNTMERRVSCLKRKSRNSWSCDRFGFQSLACPGSLLGDATFPLGGIPSSFLQIPYLSLYFRVQHSHAGAPWTWFIGPKILQELLIFLSALLTCK